MRQAILRLLAGVSWLELTGAAASAEEALAALPDAGPELLLVDVSLPGMSGIELVRRLTAEDGPICLMVSGHSDSTYVRRARKVGAHGYVMKGDPHALLEAIEVVLDGGTWFTEDDMD